MIKDYKGEYHAYHDAKQRCTNTKHPRYADWGGRGIKFLFTSFEQFYNHIGRRPDGYSIDRINNDGDYEIGNVTWSSRSKQQLNKRAKGVRQVKSKGLVTPTWQAYISIDLNFKQLYCGPSYEAACEARREAEKWVRTFIK